MLDLVSHGATFVIVWILWFQNGDIAPVPIGDFKSETACMETLAEVQRDMRKSYPTDKTMRFKCLPFAKGADHVS